MNKQDNLADDLHFDLAESKFRVLVEHAPEAILIIDYDNKKYIEANRNAMKLFGYSKDELTNIQLGELSPEIQPDGKNSATFSAEMIAKAIDGDPVVFEWMIKRKDGQTIPCEVRVVRLPSDNRTLVRSSIIDITDRKKAEQQEKRYRQLFQNSLFGMLSIDRAGIVLACNPAYANLLGFDQKELSGTSFMDRFKSPDQDFKALVERMEEVGSGNIQFEQELVTKAGSTVVGLISLSYAGEREGEDFLIAAVQDITEIKQSKIQIERRERQLRSFIDDTPFPVAMLDKDLNYIRISKEWAQAHKSAPEVLMGKNHFDLNPHYPLRWKIAYHKALKGKRIRKERDYILLEDGSKQWFRWEAGPWYDHDDSIGGIILHQEDIGPQIKEEEAIKEQEYLFRSVFDGSNLGLMVCDISNTRERFRQMKRDGFQLGPEGFSPEEMQQLLPHIEILTYNRQLRELFGFDESQIITTKRLFTFIKNDWQKLFGQELIALYNDQSSFEAEFEIVDSESQTRHIYLSVNYPPEDYVKVVYGMLDITDLRVSVEALRDSETRYRTMFEGNLLGVIYSNRLTGVIRFNPAFQDMFGFSSQEMNELDENDILYPEYHEESDRKFNALRQGEIRSFQMEKKYKRKDGSDLFANTTVTGLFDNKDSYYGSVTILEDVTQKMANQIFIERQNDELKKINTELDQFVYSAAHDLRSPIANVIGLMDLIRHEEISERAREYLNLQEKSLSRLDEFISSIVNYSKNSRLELNLSNFDLREMIEESVAQHQHIPHAGNMKISVVTEGECDLRSDQDRLNVVINNLVSNSIRYMDCAKSEQRLDVICRPIENMCEVIFRDNGVGIEKEDLERIFELFYRANHSSEGTGIGLYLVKETVEKLGGTIHVDSEFGKGTEFRFTVKNFNDHVTS